MQRIMSKRKQEEGHQCQCPLCRHPLSFGPQERTVTITPKFMTELMNKYGGCDSKFVNTGTKLFEAPRLKKGTTYASHPGTQATVQMACQIQGPHQCQMHRCVAPFCNNSLQSKGCQCMSLTSDQKKTLRDATWGVAGEQQASGADERRKVKVKEQMPALPAPALPAPSLPAPALPAPAQPSPEIYYISD